MKSKSTQFLGSNLLTPARALLAAAGVLAAAGACTAEFEVQCPSGTTQTAGGGDVGNACTPNDQLGGSAGVGGAGSGGAPSMGGGGGMAPVPPGGVCSPNATKCEGDAQQTCGADGQWGAAAACDIACDGAGSKCVVPVQLATGFEHACARLSDDTIRCWGSDVFGEAGNGAEAGEASKPTLVDGITGVLDVVANNRNTCARLSDETAVCWGLNDQKQVQPTNDKSVLSPVLLAGATNVKQIAVSGSHVCFINGQGNVFCKGNNSNGQLGDDDPSGQPEDQEVFVPARNLPAQPRQIFASGTMSFAVLEDNTVACWGLKSLCGGADDGVGDSASVSRPTKIPNLSTVQSLGRMNGPMRCALRIDGRLMCWGENQFGQLGRGSVSSNLIEPIPDFVGGINSIVQASTGGRHVCAVSGSGELFCWGANDSGQLGAVCGAALPCQTTSADVFYVSLPAKIDLPGAVEVSAGDRFACARTSDAKVYCWGANTRGQLGNGTKGGGVSVPTLVRWK